MVVSRSRVSEMSSHVCLGRLVGGLDCSQDHLMCASNRESPVWSDVPPNFLQALIQENTAKPASPLSLLALGVTLSLLLQSVNINSKVIAN